MSPSCSAEMPAAGSVGAREVFVLTAEAPAPLDTKRWVGQRFTCSVESGVRVHRPGACVTATTALDYASRDCRHVELDPCHMTPGRVVRHHCSRCRTTPPSSRHLEVSYDTAVVRHLEGCRTTPLLYDTWGPSYDTTVVRHLGSVSYDTAVVRLRHLSRCCLYGGRRTNTQFNPL